MVWLLGTVSLGHTKSKSQYYEGNLLTDKSGPPSSIHKSKDWQATECHSSFTISLVVTRKTTRNYYAHSELSPGNVKICDSARMTSL